MKKRATEKDYIAAARRGSRQADIEAHGKPLGVAHTHVHKSKKAYDRKKEKAVHRELPLSFGLNTK
jgi:hypothetical protein